MEIPHQEGTNKYPALKKLISAIVFILCVVFVVKFGGPTFLKRILRQYVEFGIGNCQKIPVLCLSPETEIVNPDINRGYLAGLAQVKFADMQVILPKSFIAVKERLTKMYYKKNPRKHKGAVAYLLHQKRGFFINMFPQAKKLGIKNDYEFFDRIMRAKISNIIDINDMFFTITKTIFTPNLGDTANIMMVKFSMGDKKGFINYGLTNKGNYFDCNIFDSQDEFFKVYIKDMEATLDLDKVLAIVSTVKGPQ